MFHVYCLLLRLGPPGSVCDRKSREFENGLLRGPPESAIADQFNLLYVRDHRRITPPGKLLRDPISRHNWAVHFLAGSGGEPMNWFWQILLDIFQQGTDTGG
jgi:hypothetical protein